MGSPGILSSHGFIEIAQIEYVNTAYAVGTVLDTGPVLVEGMSEIVLSFGCSSYGTYGLGQTPDKVPAIFQSVDGTNWDMRWNIAFTTGNIPGTITVPVIGRYAKFRWAIQVNPQVWLYVLAYARATRSDEECLS